MPGRLVSRLDRHRILLDSAQVKQNVWIRSGRRQRGPRLLALGGLEAGRVQNGDRVIIWSRSSSDGP
jgi:hypothetical protein